MKAKDLIAKLQNLNSDTLIYWTNWDAEFDIIHVTLVDNVDSDGGLIGNYRIQHPNQAEIQGQWRDD